MSRIVVGVDGSEESKHALGWAVDEAHLRTAGLEVVSVVTRPPVISIGMAPEIVLPQLDDIVKEGESALYEVIDEVVSRGDVSIIPRVVEGRPAEELVRRARGADLLVVGARGLGGFRGLLLGSVSQQCVHHAPCPVVVVPTDERS